MQPRLGHVHIKVRDIGRAVDFYTRFVGLTVTERVGDRWVFMSAGDMHHELALQDVGPDAPIPSRSSTGLFHIAFEVPDQRSLASRYQTLVEHGVPVATVDHRISWALYFSDPDANGVELYWDTRRKDGVERWEGRDRPLPAGKLLRVLRAS